MNIPDEAVEAAAHEFFHDGDLDRQVRRALAAALPYLELCDMCVDQGVLREGREHIRRQEERIRELEEFIADSECTCLPYAKRYDGMCQQCLSLKDAP